LKIKITEKVLRDSLIKGLFYDIMKAQMKLVELENTKNAQYI